MTYILVIYRVQRQVKREFRNLKYVKLEVIACTQSHQYFEFTYLPSSKVIKQQCYLRRHGDISLRNPKLFELYFQRHEQGIDQSSVPKAFIDTQIT